MHTKEKHFDKVFFGGDKDIMIRPEYHIGIYIFIGTLYLFIAVDYSLGVHKIGTGSMSCLRCSAADSANMFTLMVK